MTPPKLPHFLASVTRTRRDCNFIPPSDYALDGTQPLRLVAHTTVVAYGARFHLPKTLGDRARVVLFAGENVEQTSSLVSADTSPGTSSIQRGEQNTWEPNANTRGIVITTTPGGATDNLTFRDITSDGLAGSAINVLGAEKHGSESQVETYARNITVENCTLERTGKFMWDYGLLWQITIWPEDYTPREQAMAAKYFRNDLVQTGVTMADGDDRVRLDNHVEADRREQERRTAGRTLLFRRPAPAQYRPRPAVLRGRQRC